MNRNFLFFLLIIIVSCNKQELNYDDEEFVKDRDLYEIQLLADPSTGEIPQNIKVKEQRFIEENFKSGKGKGIKLQSTYSWRRRGPYHVGGRSRALGIDVRDENRLLAGGASGGVWLSEDGGQNWRKVTPSHYNHNVTSIAQDPRPGKQDIWYYTTGERIASRFRTGYGVYKSIDNGETWFLLESTVGNSREGAHDSPFDFTSRVIVNPVAPDSVDEVLVSTTWGGIHRSIDGGETWDLVLGRQLAGSASNLFTEVAVTSDGVFYATLSKASGSTQFNAQVSGIFRSNDGVNWTNITPEDYNAQYLRVVMGINPSDENEIYFFANTSQSGIETTNSRGTQLWHSLWKFNFVSEDTTGVTGDWVDLTDNLPKPELVRHQVNTQGGYDQVIKVHPTDPDVVYIGGVNLYRSTNGWTTPDFDVVGGTCPGANETCDYHFRYPNHHADLHDVQFSKNDPLVMYTTSDGGIHKTLDNMSDSVVWISLNNGFYSTQFYNVGVDHVDTENYSIIGGTQDNGTLFSNQESFEHMWTDVLRADGFNCEIANNGEFIITSQNLSRQPMIRMWMAKLDEGGNVTDYRRIDPAGGLDFQWNTAMALDNNDSGILYIAGGKTVWRHNNLRSIELNNSGDSLTEGWDALENSVVNGQDEIISCISNSIEPAHIVYYGTTNGSIFRIENANIGQPEVERINRNGMPLANVSCVAVDPNDADKIIAVYSNYGVESLWYSEDAGQNWEAVGSNLEYSVGGAGDGPSVIWVEIVPFEERNVYLAGTTSGLFMTTEMNGDLTAWQLEADEIIGNAFIHNLDSRPADGYVAIGSYSQGIYDGFINAFPDIAIAPNLIYPTNKSLAFLDTANLSWTSIRNAAYYKLQVSKNENFTDLIFDDYSKTNTILIRDLEQGYKDYYWRVASVNAGGLGEYSETYSFKTSIAPPGPVYPEDGAREIIRDLMIVWEDLEEAQEYHIQLNNLSDFSDPFQEDTVSEATVYVGDLRANRNVYWRVRAKDENGWGIFSESFRFRTGTEVSIENEILNDDIYYLNGNIILNVEFKDNIDVNITIRDFNGKLVSQISSQKNTSKININKRINLNSGSYFVMFESNKGTFTKKIQVTR